MIKHKIASGPIRWYMKKLKFDGWTSFWNTIYYIDFKSLNNARLRRHELKHIEQIRRDGRLKFAVKYGFYTVKYGYYNNPYEIEARAAEEITPQDKANRKPHNELKSND